MFQTELVCGIICNYSWENPLLEVLDRFQTELVCGIICNISTIQRLFAALTLQTI